MSMLPAVSALSMISDEPMSDLSRTLKPCFSSVWRYSSPRMYCSVKFFVPSVIVGAALLALVSEPPPPQPGSAATMAATATARRI